MSFLGLATQKDVWWEKEYRHRAEESIKDRIAEVQKQVTKHAESIRYLKDEISKLRRKCK